MTNNESTEPTKFDAAAAAARRLAYWNQPIVPTDRPARRDLPRRNRRTSVRHRAIR